MRNRKYCLRGDNRKLAIKLGLPTEYDRVALMAVSVLRLSHWRLDVTVGHYMLGKMQPISEPGSEIGDSEDEYLAICTILVFFWRFVKNQIT